MDRLLALIAIKHEDGREVHIASNMAGMNTYCGVDGDAPTMEQETVPLGRSNKITCENCFKLWERAQGFRLSDFNIKR